jgi:hypothetical protein
MAARLILAAIVLVFMSCASQKETKKNSEVSKETAKSAYQELDKEVGKDTLK